MAQSLPNRTPQAAYSPRYLDPIQEQRILSWRSHASPTSSVCQSPSPSVSPAQSKSSGETCTCGYATSICSCSSKRKKRKARSYYKRSAKTTSGGSVDRPGGPDFQQVHGQRVNPPPQTQFGPGPTMPMPEPTINIPQLPRIAGTRDPVSRNYWKAMFPPVGGPGLNTGSPFGLTPGLHPPQNFGMGGGRPPWAW